MFSFFGAGFPAVELSEVLCCEAAINRTRLPTHMSNASSIRCLITAGPTREFLDPVRFLSNPSTGKMGFALAEAALRLGWNVDLVAGPVSLPEPEGAILYPVVSAEEMFHQADALFDACDVCIMAAAVSDFRPAHYQAQKEKKTDAALSLQLERTPDILATLTERKLHQTVVGFAAETQHLAENARAKLAAKRCDLIVANDLTQPGAGFATDTNTVTLFAADGSDETLGPALKSALATEIIHRIARLRP